MADLVGNVLVAQSGGPTAVINSSLAGVILEAGKHPDHITDIFGGLYGIRGILEEELIDLQEEKCQTIEGLKHTPAAALGTCRYKIDFKNKPEQAARDMDRLFQVFQAHNIRYFFYAGGNDSQDTAHKIHEQAIQRGYEIRVIGIPKTIDNDLPHTDHCPGFGSVIKFNAAIAMEVGADVGSMATGDGSCCIIEVMGRSAGWIAAGTVLAKRTPSDPPHIILVPEVAYRKEAFIAKVKATVVDCGYCIVVAGEGIKDEQGHEVAADTSRLDAFGHPLLSGVGDVLADTVQDALGFKSRSLKLGYSQRAAAHFASETDVEEAAACGAAAVRAAIEGKSGFMVKLVRLHNNPYRWATDLHPLAEVANVEHLIPRDWLTEDGFLPNEKFIEYAKPLIAGQLLLPMDGGLPKFVTLDRVRLQTKLPPR